MSHQQLTLEERYHIQVFVKERLSQAEIALRLGRDRSTIWRELKRNSSLESHEPYLARRAERIARQRRVDKSKRCRKIRGELQLLVEKRLKWGWSPEQIAGRLFREKGVRLSHETIYQHVLRDAAERGMLRYCLRFGGYKHHRFKRSQVAQRRRERKRWIASRPDEANKRTELGHWERDCVLGTRGGAVLLTMVERRSRLTRIRRVRRCTAKLIGQATKKLLAPYRRTTKSVTNDNGKEFSDEQLLEKALQVPIYFTEPSAPWQRGSIENLNGLIRQYVNKRVNIDELPNNADIAIEETLNHRPRKTLGFQTPYEVFFDEKEDLMNQETMHFGLEFNAPSCLG